jgi:biopolymer transport protein ExbB/TolQ
MTACTAITSIVLVVSYSQGTHWEVREGTWSVPAVLRFTMFVLLVTFGRTIAVAVARGFRYHQARMQSREFTDIRRTRNVADALAVAERLPQSPAASVTASGLKFLQSASLQSKSDLAELLDSRMAVARAETAIELKAGLNSLASIVTTAPLVGLFGTLIGILNTFKGYSMSRATVLSMVAGSIANALVTTVASLFVAVLAVWAYNYFTNKMDGFYLEMNNASLQLLTNFESFDLTDVHLPPTILKVPNLLK